MSSLNRATLIGHLGRDPEVRYTQANQKIVHLSIATSERWKDRSGSDQERTEWHRVVIFNEALAEVVTAVRSTGRKGGVTIKIEIGLASKGDDSTLKLSATIAERLPAEEHGDTIMYAIGDGQLSRRDPRQLEMPGLKEVRAPSGPAKEVV